MFSWKYMILASLGLFFHFELISPDIEMQKLDTFQSNLEKQNLNFRMF